MSGSNREIKGGSPLNDEEVDRMLGPDAGLPGRDYGVTPSSLTLPPDIRAGKGTTNPQAPPGSQLRTDFFDSCSNVLGRVREEFS